MTAGERVALLLHDVGEERGPTPPVQGLEHRIDDRRPHQGHRQQCGGPATAPSIKLRASTMLQTSSHHSLTSPLFFGTSRDSSLLQRTGEHNWLRLSTHECLFHLGAIIHCDVVGLFDGHSARSQKRSVELTEMTMVPTTPSRNSIVQRLNADGLSVHCTQRASPILPPLFYKHVWQVMIRDNGVRIVN